MSFSFHVDHTLGAKGIKTESNLIQSGKEQNNVNSPYFIIFNIQVRIVVQSGSCCGYGDMRCRFRRVLYMGWRRERSMAVAGQLFAKGHAWSGG